MAITHTHTQNRFDKIQGPQSTHPFLSHVCFSPFRYIHLMFSCIFCLEDNLMHVCIMGKRPGACAFVHISECCSLLLNRTSSHVMVTWLSPWHTSGLLEADSGLEIAAGSSISDSRKKCHKLPRIHTWKILELLRPVSTPGFGAKAEGSSTCQIFFGSGLWN